MSEPTDVDLAVLRGWPLPEPGSNKTARGVVLMVGGSAGVPGAMVLAGEASLRAGAGKLQVVTTRSVAGQMAVSIPEALVRRAEEVESGDISPSAADEIVELAHSASAVLLGPGIMSPDDAVSLLSAVVPRLRDIVTSFTQNVPHSGTYLATCPPIHIAAFSTTFSGSGSL